MQARITIAGNSRTGLLLQLYLPSEWCALFGERLGFRVLGEMLHAGWGDEHGDERTRGKTLKNKIEVENELHLLRLTLRDASEWLASEIVSYELYINLNSAPTSQPDNGGNNG